MIQEWNLLILIFTNTIKQPPRTQQQNPSHHKQDASTIQQTKHTKMLHSNYNKTICWKKKCAHNGQMKVNKAREHTITAA